MCVAKIGTNNFAIVNVSLDNEFSYSDYFKLKKQLRQTRDILW